MSGKHYLSAVEANQAEGGERSLWGYDKGVVSLKG